MRKTIGKYISILIVLLSLSGMFITVRAISGVATEEATSIMETKLTNELSVANEYLASVQEDNKDTIAAPMIDLFINLQNEEFINDITSDEDTQNLLEQIQAILNEYNIK